MIESAVLLLWAGIIFGGWILPFISIPWYQRARYRHRLWRLRDAIVDDILRGRLPRTGIPLTFITLIEAVIADVRRLNWLNLLLLRIAAEPPDEKWYQESIARLSDEERHLFKTHDSEFVRATGSFLVKSSPAMWILCLPTAVVIVIQALRQGARPIGEAKARAASHRVPEDAVFMFAEDAARRQAERPRERLAV